jgi:hypothetical protein
VFGTNLHRSLIVYVLDNEILSWISPILARASSKKTD